MHAMTLCWQCPPQKLLCQAVFTPSKLDALLYLPQLCPLISQLPDPVSYNADSSDIFWRRILQGEPWSKKHFESLLNVVSREKL